MPLEEFQVVTSVEMAEFLNFPDNLNNGELIRLIEAAERHLEALTGKAFLTQQMLAEYDGFGDYITLPRSPVQSIDEITYLDPNRNSVTLAPADYFALALGSQERTVIVPAQGKSFPKTAKLPGTGIVTVTYTAGYGDNNEDTPEPLRHAVRLLASHYYVNREATLVGVQAQELPSGVNDLIMPYRHWEF